MQSSVLVLLIGSAAALLRPALPIRTRAATVRRATPVQDARTALRGAATKLEARRRRARGPGRAFDATDASPRQAAPPRPEHV